jgi:hypothetical protein
MEVTPSGISALPAQLVLPVTTLSSIVNDPLVEQGITVGPELLLGTGIVIEAEGTESADVPLLLVALAVKVYSVPGVSPVTLIWTLISPPEVPVSSPISKSGDDVTVNVSIGRLPSNP